MLTGALILCRALAQHAASIESFLAGGDASLSAREGIYGHEKCRAVEPIRTGGSPLRCVLVMCRALAQHAASIESFLAGGDASVSAREESTALAQLMQVLHGAAPEGAQQ